MKKILIIIFLCNNYVNGQIIIYEFCFDQLDNCADYNMADPEPILTIDLNSNPNNIWQIGSTQKPVLSNAWSTPKVIITDSMKIPIPLMTPPLSQLNVPQSNHLHQLIGQILI